MKKGFEDKSIILNNLSKSVESISIQDLKHFYSNNLTKCFDQTNDMRKSCSFSNINSQEKYSDSAK